MKQIGRYIIRGLLGRGGMGKVFKVELPPLGRIAALKILDPDPLLAKLMGIEVLRKLFTHEAVTMAGLNHPNIVSVHDFDAHEGKPFFVMDYYANNLGTLMGESYIIEQSSRLILIDKALDYTIQTLSGLDCLHDSGILHRDIKPFNLLITSRDTIKICDFGLSKLRHEAFKGPANLNVGSPYYAAPEQEADPDGIDARADLYPVGIMLYRMLTRRLPYINDGDEGYRPPSHLNPDLDRRWDTFMAKAIARHPGKRFANAGKMKQALAELQGHWHQQKEKTCALSAVPTGAASPESLAFKVEPRNKPLKINPRDASDRFNLDALWQPIDYTINHFERQGTEAMKDLATGLIWQQSGSKHPRSWRSAHQYIRQLNEQKYGGVQDWRLPTVDELVTLLKPSPQGEALCIAPVFDDTQRWLWSIDRRSYAAAFYVDIELGFVGWQDFSAPYYVRAVHSTG